LLRADLGSIGDDLAFEVESPASDYAIAVVVSQGGGPVAFMPHSWNECEKYDRIIEKKPLPSKPFENGHFIKGAVSHYRINDPSLSCVTRQITGRSITRYCFGVSN